MQFTAKCKKPDEFPAIIHKDGTSRVQTVSKNDSPGFRKLLEEWHAETGCPVLLNTSLNIKGMPMVNDLKDAVAFTEKYNVPVLS
jgi:carbamoyltransferase